MDTSNIKDIGIEHWERTRREFTKNHVDYNDKFDPSESYKSHKLLKDVDSTHFETIYHSLVSGRRFQEPVPLSFCMLVILNGWRSDGTTFVLILRTSSPIIWCKTA